MSARWLHPEVRARNPRARRTAWVLVAVVVLAVTVWDRIESECFGADKEATARETANRYARAHERWRLGHPDRACPERLEELNPWAGFARKDSLDLWGEPYQFICSVVGPSDDRITTDARMFVRSKGEDGFEATDDDVWSDP